MNEDDVVGLILEENNKILVERRKRDRKVAPGRVIIPGGHVEEGESLRETCERELKEELNIGCEGFELIDKRHYSLESENQLVHYFLCKNWQGNIECREAKEVSWIDSTELDELDYPKEIEVLRNFLKQ